MEKKSGFKSVKLLSKFPIGRGSYGSVYKAQCDDLVCAGKVIHSMLETEIPHAKSPLGRFLTEIEFISFLRHPNVVQFLGIGNDPDIDLPILLMELMDESLTNFLENARKPLPLHTQVSICHDIALAISFLHSNKIIHRDLSSNNVLMLGDRQAKVTDFGMAKLYDLIGASHFTQQSNTQCPGADVYMPPEAVTEKPVFTEKIDCFSFGVLAIQIATRKFPSPGNRTKAVMSAGRELLERLSECSRRERDIMMVPKDHILLGMAHDCLKDIEAMRPTASELCARLVQLKKVKQYSEFNGGNLRPGLKEEVETLVRELAMQSKVMDARDKYIQSLSELTMRLETQIKLLEQDLENALKTNIRLMKEKRTLQWQHKTENSPSHPDCCQVTWRKGPEAPCPMSRSCDAVVCGTCLYVVYQTTKSQLYVYNCLMRSWSQLPDCLTLHCSLANVKNSLVVIGGFLNDGEKTDKLYMLSSRSGQHYSWTEEYPPMPTKRDSVMAASYCSYLIILGGLSRVFTKKVEVLKVDSKQWFVAAGLPTNIHSGSVSICNNQLFVLGGWVSHTSTMYSVVTCSLGALLSTCSPQVEDEKSDEDNDCGTVDNVWSYCPLLPVNCSTCITYHNELLVLGGQDKKGNPTNIALKYDVASNSWNEFNQFEHPRSLCVVAVLPDDELMVLGGCVGNDLTKETSSSEVRGVFLL